MTTFEAVKYEGSAEIDWVDPLCAIEFHGDKFTLHNGEWGFDFPIEEFEKWKFRQQAQPSRESDNA